MPICRPTIAALLLSISVAACAPTPAPTAAAPDFTEAASGYLLIDAKSGAVLAEKSADTGFPPASTAKLATAIAALGILGPDYRFRTEILAHGTLRGGVLTGDLTLSGDGDPLLASGDLRALAVQLAAAGIRRVDGRFLYHSALPSFAEIEPAQPPGAPYNQGVGGLNLDFNRALVTRHGAGAAPTVTPAEAAALGPGPGAQEGPGADLPVRDPGRLTALMLHRFAGYEGIVLPVPHAGAPPVGSVPVARSYSQPLLEVVRAGLEYSNNLVAETIGLAAAQHLGPTPASLRDSAQTLGRWLEGNISGLDGFAEKQHNHSGLSTETRITPRQMTTLLRSALGQPVAGWRFDTLLVPGGGREGYNGRFRTPETAFRIWGKTGTMHYIKGIAGYLDARSGRRLIFALFTTDPQRRAAYDATGADPKKRAAALAWRQRAEAVEEQLIGTWVSSF